jgi:hypothetical protein
MDQLRREEIASADPYMGRGVFLAAPGTDLDAITGKLAERLGMIVPAVTWDGIGAWVDLGGVPGMTAQELESRWSATSP